MNHWSRNVRNRNALWTFKRIFWRSNTQTPFTLPASPESLLGASELGWSWIDAQLTAGSQWLGIFIHVLNGSLLPHLLLGPIGHAEEPAFPRQIPAVAADVCSWWRQHQFFIKLSYEALVIAWVYEYSCGSTIRIDQRRRDLGSETAHRSRVSPPLDHCHASAPLAGSWLVAIAACVQSHWWSWPRPKKSPKNLQWFIKGQCDTVNKNPSKESYTWGLKGIHTLHSPCREVWLSRPNVPVVFSGELAAPSTAGAHQVSLKGVTKTRSKLLLLLLIKVPGELWELVSLPASAQWLPLCLRASIRSNIPDFFLRSASFMPQTLWLGRLSPYSPDGTRDTYIVFLHQSQLHNEGWKDTYVPCRVHSCPASSRFWPTLRCLCKYQPSMCTENLSPLEQSSVSLQQCSQTPQHVSFQQTRLSEKDPSSYLFHSHLMPSVRYLGHRWAVVNHRF